MLRWLALPGFAAVVVMSADAVELTLSTRAIAQAIDIGQSRIEAVRARFHQPYRIDVSRPPVDFIDVVTPFRRVALAAETHARAGNRLFGQRDALASLGPSPERIDVLIALTFHPYNTYVGVPEYQLRLLDVNNARPPIEPGQTERIPRVGPRVQGLPLPFPGRGSASLDGAAPVSGGTIIGHFDGRSLDQQGLYDVVVIDAGQEIARGRVDFRPLR